jgi:hypothetical protein
MPVAATSSERRMDLPRAGITEPRRNVAADV